MGANVTKSENTNVQRVVNETKQSCPSVTGTNEIKRVRIVVKQGTNGDINFDQSARLDTKCVMKEFREAAIDAVAKNKLDAGTALGFNYADIKNLSSQEMVDKAIQDCGKVQSSSNSIEDVDIELNSLVGNINFAQSLDVSSQCSLDKMSKAIATLDTESDTTSGISGSALGWTFGSIAVIAVIGVGVYLVLRSGGGSGGSYAAPPPMYAPQPMMNPYQSPYQQPQMMDRSAFGQPSTYQSQSPSVNMTQSSSTQPPMRSNINTPRSAMGNGSNPTTPRPSFGNNPTTPKPLPPIPGSVTASPMMRNTGPTFVPSGYRSGYQSPEVMNPRGSPQIY
uniref:Poxvirus-like myristoylated envelope protein n=1 Tax=Clandestinovirus TaxID=2831644 RepID=A0A8F8KRR8_9VIRU|nr:poxvirus-like myristoylated envelope protein [Clandestinovirus]